MRFKVFTAKKDCIKAFEDLERDLNDFASSHKVVSMSAGATRTYNGDDNLIVVLMYDESAKKVRA